MMLRESSTMVHYWKSFSSEIEDDINHCPQLFSSEVEDGVYHCSSDIMNTRYGVNHFQKRFHLKTKWCE